MFEHIGVNTKDPVMTVKVNGDVFPRWSLLSDGSISLGAGTLAPTQETDLDVPLVTAPLTLTTMLLADSFIANDTSYQFKVDLASCTQARLTGVVKVVGVAAAKLQLRYQTTFSNTVANELIIGATSVEISLFTLGVIDSGWINMVAGAKIDNCFLGLMAIGGDGAASPIVNQVHAQFR